MNQIPAVTPPAQHQSEDNAPTQNPDGSNVLPSTTTATGAELATDEPTAGGQLSHPASLEEATGGDSTPGLHHSSDEQAAIASKQNHSRDDAAKIASLAYEYYETEGYPEGCSLQHWVRAEKEVGGGHR